MLGGFEGLTYERRLQPISMPPLKVYLFPALNSSAEGAGSNQAHPPANIETWIARPFFVSTMPTALGMSGSPGLNRRSVEDIAGKVHTPNALTRISVSLYLSAATKD